MGILVVGHFWLWGLQLWELKLWGSMRDLQLGILAVMGLDMGLSVVGPLVVGLTVVGLDVRLAVVGLTVR